MLSKGGESGSGEKSSQGRVRRRRRQGIGRLVLNEFLDRVSYERGFRACAYFLREEAAHGVAEDGLIHTKGERRHAQQPLNNSQIEQGHAYLDGDGRGARILAIEEAAPELRGESGTGGRAEWM
jgi:hypothetical protein